MALFNSSEFNGILFGEGSPSSLPPGSDYNLSATINCSTIFEPYSGNVVLISADFSGYTEITLSRIKKILGLSTPIDITSNFTTFEAEINKLSYLSANINSETEFKVGQFMMASAYGGTTFESLATVDYSAATEIENSTTFNATLNVDYTLSADITSSGTLFVAEPMNVIYLSADITSSNTLFEVDTVEIFIALNADITGSTTFEADLQQITGLSTDITSSNTLFNASASVDYSVSTDISGSTIFKTVKKIGPANTITGRTTFTAEATSPESLKETGRRRRVSFVFEVDKPNTNSSIIDEHYKIFKFYNSLTLLGETLNYVRRTASYELQSFNIDSTSHRTWTSNSDLYQLTTGDRGRIATGATGIFLGKDGHFALYTGPNVDLT